ncbi:MAG: hypothetical protein PVJ67_01595 [Candidatus Pacearchaeota archaeon]
MKTKQTLVSFLAVALVLTLVATISAADIADDVRIKVDGIYADSVSDDVAVIAGDTIEVKVYFTALEDATDVRIKAELEGEKVDVTERTSTFDIEENKSYVKTLTLKVPYELKDEVSDDIDLSLKIWNADFKTEDSLTLRVQRESYNADIKSVSVSSTVSAGETFPVDIVIKNRGYNDLDDLYVTVSIDALNLHKSAYFGDLVVEEIDDDDTDTVSGRLYLAVPYDVETGVYTVTVEASNDDTVSTAVGQIVIENDFSNTAIATTLRKTAGTNEDATYNLLLVNPTDKLKVYRIVAESTGVLTTSVSQSVVAVPASSSETVTITASASEEGQYDFNVDVITGEAIADSVKFNLDVEGMTNTATNPVVVLTIVLAIIFLVLLVVLIVLLGKKPEKTEEFGESYY